MAIGGYGRAELNPHSDIDIMFLHESDMVAQGKARPALAPLVDGLLYTLWDLGFKVGHSVRSIDDCVKVANSDMQSKTSLIEARRITGDEELFDRFERNLAGQMRRWAMRTNTSPRGWRTRRRAGPNYGNSACMQEPNIKNGCGGLRDYQNLLWMAYFKYRTRTLAELEKQGHDQRQRTQATGKRLRLPARASATSCIITSIAPPISWAAACSRPSPPNLGWHDRSAGKRLELFMGDFYTHTPQH